MGPGTAVGVLTSGQTHAEAQEDGVVIYRSIPDWSLRSTGALWRAIRSFRPDIVHVQYPTQGYQAGMLPWLVPAISRHCGARVVQTWHESFNRRDLLKFLVQALIPSRIVVVRKAYRVQFRPPFGLLASLKHPVYINSASTLPTIRLSSSQLDSLQDRYQIGDRRLIVYFGFIHPLKRIEWLFDIANPATDYVMIIGASDGQADYLASIEELTLTDRWSGRSRVVGFIDPAEAAGLLQAADALVLPLQAGGGEWNTSILAGIQQGTFVLTTSTTASGYCPKTNVYSAKIDGKVEMKQALEKYAGTKRVVDEGADEFGWASIAGRHLDLYRSMLSSNAETDALAVSVR